MAAYCYDALRYLLFYGQFLIHILFLPFLDDAYKYRMNCMILLCFQDGLFWTNPFCLHFTTHILHLLGLGQETSEKQPPSALDFVALFSLAMKEHEQSSGKKLPLVTALGNVITEYNRGIAVKNGRWTARRKGWSCTYFVAHVGSLKSWLNTMMIIDIQLQARQCCLPMSSCCLRFVQDTSKSNRT